ncbi:helix-turn-helix domain-containing protein [Aquimarina mytili]|uniref:Helix-turn-helix transcriptional regulator n=1 Tax=Aquimarina mytili TaxID=874423 RepID=A0A937DC74_9FLAO|nr:AraC family transcriptional regulator [Aquimarina mytili]MBL0684626.1 helix-turn-helix transcriptional regulator [Aquimarina mytili]
MNNPTQLDRYKSLLDFLDERFKEDISIKDIENVSFYSYRNINRIFMALHHETIGKYLKRIKLEKAAQYLKYSNNTISDIALEVGYSDIAAFSKAFKNQFNCAPSQFREIQELKQQITKEAITKSKTTPKPSLEFEIEELPSLENIKQWHLFEVSEPLIAKDFFSIHMITDVLLKNGQKMYVDEIIVYEASGDKIIKEQFFYR